MTDQKGPGMPASNAAGQPQRKRHVRHWWRWITGGIGVLVLIIVAAVAVFIQQPAPAPLTLPKGAPSVPAGPVAGTWTVAAGSVAGFRVRESALGFSNDVVGRTSAVTGDIIVSGSQVTSATLRVALTAIKIGGKTQPQFATSLGARKHPVATFTLARPVTLGPAFASGATVTVRFTGDLTMNGTSRPVTVTLAGRRDGPALQAAGSIPVSFSAWGIKGPGGFAFVGSLADHGVAEFLVVLHRAGGSTGGHGAG